jgi:hypothetical protein
MVGYTFSRIGLRTPAVVAAVLVIYVVWRGDWLGLVGLPLIYLSWSCCSPGFGCGNLCLPAVASLVVFGLGLALRSLGLVLAAPACLVTLFLASYEATGTLRPLEPDPESTATEAEKDAPARLE